MRARPPSYVSTGLALSTAVPHLQLALAPATLPLHARKPRSPPPPPSPSLHSAPPSHQYLVPPPPTRPTDRLQASEIEQTIPTIGFNVETLQYKNIKFQVWDLGGQTSIRPYWRCYYPNTDALIFVVDSADHDRLKIAKQELFAMLEVRARLLILRPAS